MRILLALLIAAMPAVSQVTMSDGYHTINGTTQLAIGDGAALTIADNNGGVIKYDQYGNPNVMVWIPAFNWAPVAGFASDKLHPAFMVNGVAKSGVWVSKYENVVIDPTTKAVYSAGTLNTDSHTYIAASRANVAPRHTISFDAARKACTNMGTGWHLMTNAEWAAIAIWCKENGTMPFGNNSYGDDIDNSTVIGNIIDGDAFGSGSSRWYTGSGGAKTGHTRTLDGIMDMNGNLWEWTDGLKLVEGKILVAGNANSSPTGPGNSFGAAEADWYDTGRWINWDGSSSSYTISDTGRGTTMQGSSPDNKTNYFGSIAGQISDDLKKLAIGPVSGGASAYGNDFTYMRNFDVRVPLRSGCWNDGSSAGVFCLLLNRPRSLVYSLQNVGFRAALVE